MYVDLFTIGLVWPEVILVLIATWMYLAGTITRGRVLWTILAAVTYGVAFFVLVWKESGLWTELAANRVGFSGPLIIDYLGQATRFFSLTVGLLLTLIASRSGLRQLSTESTRHRHDADCRVDVGWTSERSGVSVRGARVDFDSYLRPAVPGTS